MKLRWASSLRLALAWVCSLGLAAASPRPPASAPSPQAAHTGEVIEFPGQVFKVVFKQPGQKDFAKFVADTLQSAWQAYNKEFKRDDGKEPMAFLTPSNRMEVQIVSIGGGVNAQYKFLSWNGYIQVDPVIGAKDLPGLKITLCHELFHALQDAYSNMMVSGRLAHWWFEASAEWAGLKYGSPYTANEARDEIGRYKYFMSVPIQQSEKFEEGLLSYAYALLVEYAEIKSPGYVRRALNGGSVSSRAFYEELNKAAGFPDNFPDYVGNYLKVGVPNPGFWTAARMVEFDGETRIYRGAEDAPGAPENSVPERISDEKLRAAPHHFTSPPALGPLTARFYAVDTSGLKAARTLKVQLREPSLEGKIASDRALILKVPIDPKQKPSWSRLSNKGTTITGIGKDLSSVWVAVVNTWTDRDMNFDLELALDKDTTPGAEFLLDPLSFDTMNGDTKQWQDGQNGATPTSKWKVEPDGLWFDSTKDGFHMEASWTKPPASLKQGDSFTMDVTLTADGPREAQLQISPIGPMSEWELEALNPGVEVKKAAYNVYLLKIPMGKGRRTASVRMKVSLPGPWRTLNLATGEGSGGRRNITQDLLVLSINVNNTGRIQWLYAKKGARRWWDKK